ncbi:MAG: transporter related protein, partial [Candidatus Berkelbacteria bacterium]|nr:transporter related protein [Candidatus Berkelbacteria bacterium]
VQRLCDRAILLEKGRVKADGEPVMVCQDYEFTVMREVNKKLKVDNLAKKEGKKIIGKGPLKISKVKILDDTGKEKYSFFQGANLKIRVYYETNQAIDNPGLYCLFTRYDGVFATSFFSGEQETFHHKLELGVLKDKGYVELIWPEINLGDGDFYLTVGFFPKKETKAESVMYVDPYCLHDKVYKIEIKRRNRPLQTVFDQKVKIKKVEE